MFAALVACALAISALSVPADPPGEDYRIFAANKPCDLQTMIAQLPSADVVFVGEEHDDKQAHALELTILEGMHNRSPALALSLEMFERDVQGIVDEYLQGFITETHFLLASRPWPNYKEDYRPLVEYCKTQGLPVIAANAPRRYVNLVSRKGQAGLNDLPAASKAYLAPLPYSMDLPPGYEKQLDEIFGGSHTEESAKKEAGKGSGGQQPEPSPAYMKQAQALWDATMADSLAKYLHRHPHEKVLQINGAMHSDSGYGIVDRLRRLHPHLKIVIVSIKPETDPASAQPDQYAGTADFVILTHSKAVISGQ